MGAIAKKIMEKVTTRRRLGFLDSIKKGVSGVIKKGKDAVVAVKKMACAAGAETAIVSGCKSECPKGEGISKEICAKFASVIKPCMVAEIPAVCGVVSQKFSRKNIENWQSPESDILFGF